MVETQKLVSYEKYTAVAQKITEKTEFHSLANLENLLQVSRLEAYSSLFIHVLFIVCSYTNVGK